jgi:hypothetical protein
MTTTRSQREIAVRRRVVIRNILYTSGYDNEAARNQLRTAGLDEELAFRERATLSSAIFPNYDVPGSVQPKQESNMTSQPRMAIGIQLHNDA